jgi:hypothetical protein
MLFYCASQLQILAQNVQSTPSANPNPPPVSSSANAQTKTKNSSVPVMDTIVVNGEMYLGQEPISASEGLIGSDALQDRPTQRVGDLLESVPGLIVTQHAGGGKANQFYLRGYNLDHGTDLNTSVDGVPVNLPTHAHGQGYDDINFLIPELVSDIDFRKGPYYADVGDFGNAGTININYVDKLPAQMLVLEGGSFDYERMLFAGSQGVAKGNLLYAFETSHDGGAWTSPDDYRKYNGLLKFSQGDENSGFSLSAQAYSGQWNASDEYPQSLYKNGQISRFQSLDPTDGGASTRASIYGEWHEKDADSTSDLTVYGVHYYLNLYSDFTYFLDNPEDGDQFRQKDDRYIGGLHGSDTWIGKLGDDATMENTLGFQVRNDVIDLSLSNTEHREVLNVVRADSVLVSNISPYYDNKVQWTDWFRTDLGLRTDLFYYDDRSDNPSNNGNVWAAKPSPKLSLTFGPWNKTELYLQAGEGLRSNDARGVLSTVDPSTGSSVVRNRPIVRTQGAEIGLKTDFIPGLESNLSFWTLHSQSELYFDGDEGASTDSDRPGFRYGVEWNNSYSPLPWLKVEDSVAFSRSQFTDNDHFDGLYIPESVESVGSAGITVHNLDFAKGLTLSMDMRYLGPRALVANNSERSEQVLVFNAHSAYEINDHVKLFLDFLNLTNSHYNDADYFYQSAYPKGAAPINDFQVHPGEPFNLRGGITYSF